MQRRAWRQTIARDYSSKLNLGRDNGILAGDAGKHGGVLVVDSLVVDEIESGYEMEFRAAEFGLEGSGNYSKDALGRLPGRFPIGRNTSDPAIWLCA